MTISRRSVLQAATGAAVASSLPHVAFAQSRAETLRYVTGNNINTLDLTMLGATREAFGLSMCTYDRLFAFGRKQVNGNWVFDANVIRGELAAGYEMSADHMKITVKLRPDAIWHDGSPVTAEDVKWSLDRAVTAKSLAGPQFNIGSLLTADQFKIVDPHTIEVSLPKPNRLALSDLCVPYAIMINSKVAKQHATADDPWAQDWLKSNTAGSGAYTVESFKPGESVILRRNEKWKHSADGSLPFFKRVIVQTVPEPATRTSLIQKGDADLSIDLSASDIPVMEKTPKVKVVSTPQTNGFTHISMNTKMAPFDKVGVRKAIAAALPYEDMFKAALFDRGAKLYGAHWTTPPDISFPQAMPNNLDLVKAKQLLTEAGFPNGFSTTFTISTGQAATAEPMAALLKESLGKIGIQVDIQKKADSDFNTGEGNMTLPFFTDGATAWLPYTDYFFYLYFTRAQRWNFSNWINADMEKLASAAQLETDPEKYKDECMKMLELFAAETPLIMLWQPNHDAVMASTIDGYTYEYYRQADFRELKRV